MKNIDQGNKDNLSIPEKEKDPVNILLISTFSIFFYSVIKTIKSAILYHSEINFSIGGFTLVFISVFIGCKLFVFLRR
jgi:hypothetical protein